MGLLSRASDQPLAVLPVKTGDGLAYLQDMLHGQDFRSLVTSSLPYSFGASSSCACPYQTEGSCHCKEAILLVYGESQDPLTLLVECRGPWVCIYLCKTSITNANQAEKQRLISLLAPAANGLDG